MGFLTLIIPTNFGVGPTTLKLYDVMPLGDMTTVCHARYLRLSHAMAFPREMKRSHVTFVLGRNIVFTSLMGFTSFSLGVKLLCSSTIV